MVSYLVKTIESVEALNVSVPSRGMGGFLQEIGIIRIYDAICFRPLSRYGWFPTKMTSEEWYKQIG